MNYRDLHKYSIIIQPGKEVELEDKVLQNLGDYVIFYNPESNMAVCPGGGESNLRVYPKELIYEQNNTH